jgi:uncharacterized cupin superfamily protein
VNQRRITGQRAGDALPFFEQLRGIWNITEGTADAIWIMRAGRFVQTL